ncbi:related to negative regulator of mitosis [Ustilago trichophora]|uniref:Related to negative regulator of mitosis n=1 Tax=Ustilago trichophora TaxID=86804 RepID=A0A5C3EPA8_9BASI|nr:related to negative regulator of mitosis [Ustilago trichophora]
MSAAERISQRVRSRTRSATINWDPSLAGETSELLTRLQKIRSRSTATTQGSFVSSAPQQTSGSSKRRPHDRFEQHGSADDELRWQDNFLTWTRGSTLQRTFSFSNPVLQAFWTFFHVSSPDTIQLAPGKMRVNQDAHAPARALCVFFEQAIHIHFPGLGEQVDMDLPFRFSKAFPAAVGFLVQRQIESEDERIASRLQRPATLTSSHGASSSSSSSSNIGYPFPDLSRSSDSSYSLSHPLDDTDQASASQLHEYPSRLLPMVFYLSRCYDDLVPVDRFPQLSFSSAPASDPRPLTHGPASPFGEMDETVVFASTESDQRHPTFVVTTSLRNSAIRVYAFAARPNAFEATATLLSTPRIHSTLNAANATGSTHGTEPYMSASQYQDDYQQTGTNGARNLLDTPAAPNGTALGRGFPSTLRRSARVDLERRTSGLTSAGMGRDPSGRSRRISAMHSGAPDRRSTGRKDDQASQGRDRTLGNISHTVDGLRLQSQAYQHETMMEELGAGGTSMRITTNPTSSARLRRSSQAAARTPYSGPRGSNRTSSAAMKSRPSMTLSRLETSMDTGRLTSVMTANAPDGIRADGMDAEGGLGEDDEVDLARIADMDSFARSFACVCLLDEIKVPGLASQPDAPEVHVRSAAFDRFDADAAYLFLSVPSTNQTFCRRLGYQLLGSADRSRHLPFCKVPNKAQASAVIPYSDLLPVRSLSSVSTEVVTRSSNGTFHLHFGPPSSFLPSLDISGFGPLEESLMRLSEGTSSVELEALATGLGSKIRLVSRGARARIDVEIDFRPKCATTARVLTTLMLTLPNKLAAQINADWIKARFLAGTGLRHRYGRAAVGDDWSALLGVLAPNFLNAVESDPGSAAAFASTAQRLFADDPLMSSLAPFNATAQAKEKVGIRNASVTVLARDEAEQVMLSLYLLAEETHLDTSHPEEEAGKIAHLAVALAHRHGASAWTDALYRRFPSSQRQSLDELRPDQATESASAKDVSESKAPPIDLYQALLGMISCDTDTKQASSLESWIESNSGSVASLVKHTATAFPLLDAVLRTFAVFRQAQQNRQHVSSAVVESMITHGLDQERLRQLPFGVALPLYQAVRCCQIEPPSGKSAEFYRTVQRAELVLNVSTQRGLLSTANVRQIPKQLIRTLPEDAPLDAICAQLFSRDFRLRDVVAMLQTDAINSVYVAEGENQTEAAITEQHNAAVAAIGERTKALPPGRAMLFMTSRPFSPTHKWRISSICLAVKVRPRGTTIEPDTKAETAGLDWPEFHNGVASVLELNLAANVNVDSKWIFAHLGEQVTARHAGFLYGLGLMKQLPSLTPVHVFRYLKMRNNLLTIGFLLGMAVSTVGTADPTARHLIGMQLTAFLPPGSAPLNLSTITQTAGILAMGLVFLGSNHRWTAKRMLDQIGAQESPTANIQPQHREAYSMSAGLALGLVYLGKGRGDGMKSLPDKRIISRLAHLIKGRSDANEGLSFAVNSRPDGAFNEDHEINLTSAPAALAFGLIYLRSGCQTIADVMAPPRTPRELDLLRPDVLFAHVLARSLILWDSIQPAQNWLESVLPAWMQKRIDSGKQLSEAAQLAQINMQAGACFALGLKYAGSKDQKARECLWEQLEKLELQVKVQTVSFFSKIRKAAIQAALDQVRISLGMVLAGSGDVDLLRNLRKAHGDVDGETCYGSHMASHMALGLLFLGGGRFTLGSSDLGVAALLISFLPPFPRWSGDNRAHLQAFRHLWYLAIEPRLLVASDVDTNQLVSLPVKILANETGPTDGRSFTPVLLPNRHLFGRIESATARYWPASIDSRSIAERSATSASVAASIARASSTSTSQMLFVKRKTAHLDYLADPHGSRSLTSQVLETAPMDVSADANGLVGPGAGELREAMRGFTAAGKHRELARSLCQLSSAPSHLEGTKDEDTMVSLMRTVVMECLTMDKMYILPAYMSIVQLEEATAKNSGAWLRHHRDLCFADDFYRLPYGRLFSDDATSGVSKQQPLIQPDLLTRLRRRVQQQAQSLFEGDAALRDAVVAYLMTKQDEPPSIVSRVEDFWTLVIASEVPSAAEVRDLVHVIGEYIRASGAAAGPSNDTALSARMKASVRMITDAAFGGTSRRIWTTTILDHVIERSINGDEPL